MSQVIAVEVETSPGRIWQTVLCSDHAPGRRGEPRWWLRLSCGHRELSKIYRSDGAQVVCTTCEWERDRNRMEKGGRHDT